MKNFLLIIFIIVPILAFSQSVTTDAATNVSYTSATLNGEFTDVNGVLLYDGKFEYDEDGVAPFTKIIAADSSSARVNGKPTKVDISNLTPGTKYYFRFRANYFDGTVYYGSTLSFTTLTASAPSVETGVEFSVSLSSVNNSNNSVIAENGAPIDSFGVVYSDLNNPPSINDMVYTFLVGTGVDYTGSIYTASLNNFQQATTYHARAYATNSAGTGYGSIVRAFTTLPSTRAAINSMVSNAPNELTIDFTASSGSQTMILMREGTQISDYPANATTYTGNATFGSGDDLGNNTYVIYAGGGAKGSVTVTNIDGAKDYYIDIVDAAESGSDIVYFYDNDQMSSADDSNLPVELVYFNGEIDGNDNILSWATASELNNHYFKLEKSYDLTNFTVVDEVFGHGNSLQLNEYSVSDNDENNVVYYRLSQYDFDGTETVFDVIAIQKTQASEINIEKVLLADNMLNVSVKTTELNSQLEIYNLNGKLIHSEEIHQNGLNTLNINMSELSKGIYLMKLSNEQEISVMKFYY